jgi:hypothetical protein
MTKGLEIRRAELVEREAGSAELQLFAFDNQFLSGQRYDPRGLALLEAEQVRSALEAAGWSCARCGGERWVCVVHPDQRSDHEGCDAREGEPCPHCNTGSPPRPPKDFVSYVKP